MNRRSFLKLMGIAAIGTVFPIPKTPVEEISKIVLPECPGCKAGFPIKERLGWIVYKPVPIILNDNAIIKIALTGA